MRANWALDGRIKAQIKSVAIGRSFLVIEGWAASIDGTAIAVPLAIDIDGARHPITGLLSRADTGRSGVSLASGAFCLDIAQATGGERAQTLSIMADEIVLETVELDTLPSRFFRPVGSLDIIASDRVAGWIFDPGLWHDPADDEGVAITIGQYRLPVQLTLQRHDLPYLSAKAGRALGFYFNPLVEMEAWFGRAAIDALRESANHRLTLESRGHVIASGLLSLEEGLGQIRPIAAPEPPTRSIAAAVSAHSNDAVYLQDPDGFIDFFAYSASLGGWLFAGWLRHEALERDVLAGTRVRIDGQMPVLAEFATYARPDVESFGVGVLGFAESACATLEFKRVEIESGKPAWLQTSAAQVEVDERDAVEEVRKTLLLVPNGLSTGLGKILTMPIYEGVDTVNQLSVVVHLEIDEVILAPAQGAMIIGWFVDSTSAVSAIRLRSPGQPAISLLPRWIPVARPDIREAFADSFVLQGDDWGFHSFVPMASIEEKRYYLELELHDGTIAFKPLPQPRRSGRAGIIRALTDVQLTRENVKYACSEILAPTVLGISRHQMATRQASSQMLVGLPPAEPRCSIIIPFYDRLDFLNYQMALFSEHDEGVDEYVIVLDQPERREEFLGLARAAYRRYGVPMRLVLPPQNLGYAGASNEGLGAARGEFICFLNSDVMPKTAYWVAELIAALRAAPVTGLLGARLLFEDNTVQHMGMHLEPKEEFDDILFPVHPNKGRALPRGAGVRAVPLVTGALMMMRRALALECGGFDTDYVIGDFEDADLGMKVRAKNLECAVHDGVELFHLERKSQSGPFNRWRQNLTLVNAWIFNQRWEPGLFDQADPGKPVQIV